MEIPRKKLLIIDDEENMLHMLEALLSRSGYDISSTRSGSEALVYMQHHKFDFILCDVRMPEMDGFSFLEKTLEKHVDATIIMMSAYGNIDIAIAAMKAGAYDFISKPFKKDEVLLTLKKAEEREYLRQENKTLRGEIERIRINRSFSQIVWQSKAMGEAIAIGEKVAKYDTTVLITGESGTGKELLAQGIHFHSPRKNRQFFAINCGSIPGELLESELFGYVKGAFTGADKNKKGMFEEADGSTLFLDEIGELPISMQVKLLRVLQEGEIKPLGANVSRKIDVRILAATAKNLEDEVGNGKFREDLFYRLNVLLVKLPPLRSRIDDIPLLCQHFIKKFNLSLKRNISFVHPVAMEKLLAHSWPGNVRELENVIQRCVVLAENDCIDCAHLPSSVQNGPVSRGVDYFQGIESLKEAQKILETRFIERALEKTGGNKSNAAKLLQLSYPSLLYKIKEYNL
jgi:two-component system response regulator AtoC